MVFHFFQEIGKAGFKLQLACGNICLFKLVGEMALLGAAAIFYLFENYSHFTSLVVFGVKLGELQL